MHLEERKGRLELVLEKSVVDVNSPGVSGWSKHSGASGWRPHRVKITTAIPAPSVLPADSEEDRPITLLLNAMDGECRRADHLSVCVDKRMPGVSGGVRNGSVLVGNGVVKLQAGTKTGI
jgi:hypothetical protein